MSQDPSQLVKSVEQSAFVGVDVWTPVSLESIRHTLGTSEMNN